MLKIENLESKQLWRCKTPNGLRWAFGEHFLPRSFSLSLLLEISHKKILPLLDSLLTDEPSQGEILAPIDPYHEVWACGVTYIRSREARKQESSSGDIYEKVYKADRPEIFLKAIGWRVVGHDQIIRVREDSRWNAPEPELTLLINRYAEIVGYCAGNDLTSRDIEGENPLYLPQAKIFKQSCSLGPGLQLISETKQLANLPIRMEIQRRDKLVFKGDIDTNSLNRSFESLVSYLFREIDFPNGVFLMTGTGIVPDDDFSLQPFDRVRIQIADMVLENEVN